jgi:hypothetical protein
MNKRGGLLDLIVLMGLSFVAVLFFAGWMFTHQDLTDALLGVPDDNVNITGATTSTFSQINSAMVGLRWVAAAIIFGSIIAILISNFLVKAHPIFLIPYILFVILSIVFSAYISNSYETLLTSGTLAPTLQGFSFANFFFLNLPIWITVIGIAGGIMLFVGITADKDLGGSLA